MCGVGVPVHDPRCPLGAGSPPAAPLFGHGDAFGVPLSPFGAGGCKPGGDRGHLPGQAARTGAAPKGWDPHPRVPPTSPCPPPGVPGAPVPFLPGTTASPGPPPWGMRGCRCGPIDPKRDRDAPGAPPPRPLPAAAAGTHRHRRRCRRPCPLLPSAPAGCWERRAGEPRARPRCFRAGGAPGRCPPSR